MRFLADLHLHSKYSRATAKNLDLEHIYQASMIKGITVVGTGDFTYPDWIDQIEEKLEPAETGLFKLKPELSRELYKDVPKRCHNKVRFILQCEISSIYKKNNRVRKNHNLIYFDNIESVKAFNSKLDKIGNIRSDGRPILGLDAEKLLELMLMVDDSGMFIPAHIWTPWFSMFGSKSGFDTIEECFGSLSKYIFAAETGLSSDLPMNFRIKNLDNLSFVSNSDAHSPRFVGRNASVFNTDLSFAGIRDALEKKDQKKYIGTIDMHPELGKYHLDGHRKCNVCLNPEQTIELNGICPECNKPLTLGVLHRVQELADREEGFMPENRHGFQKIVPLAEILSEIFEVGPNTKTVNSYYNKAVETIGPELEILLDKNMEEIEKANIPLLAQALEKIRLGDITASAGFDGEFGKVRIFDHETRQKLKGENLTLFGSKSSNKKKTETPKPIKQSSNLKKKARTKPAKIKKIQKDELNREQKMIVHAKAHPLIVEAGPGTGKTRTLTEKIIHLIKEKKVDGNSILALTFTNKAAHEMGKRIKPALVCTATFHSFCLMVLKEYTSFDFDIADNEVRESLIKQACAKSKKIKPGTADLIIQREKQNLNLYESYVNKKDVPIKQIWHKYQSLLSSHNLCDYEDLISMTVNLFTKEQDLLLKVKKRFTHIFVDEYQDINKAQYVLVKLMAGNGKNLMVIGDPDQSIYGFRGSDNKYFKQFARDFPQSVKITLNRNYRSTQTILDASFQLITDAGETGSKKRIFSNISGKEKIIIVKTASERAEAVAVGKMIEELVGGISSLSAQIQITTSEKEYSFADFAILFRTKKQAIIFEEIFEKANIPFQSARKESKDKNNKDKPLNAVSPLNPLYHEEQDFFKFEAEKVSLMSMHASKGLEFPVVFIAGCEKTFIPFARDGKTVEDIKEEKRLFYVAMTRAKDILCLTHAKKRMVFGKTLNRKKSEFLSDIEESLKQYQSSSPAKKIKKQTATQLDLFDQG